MRPILAERVTVAEPGRGALAMFIDENSVWPREEPAKQPEPARSSDGAARLFLVFALLAAFLPFSLGSVVAIVRYVGRMMAS